MRQVQAALVRPLALSLPPSDYWQERRIENHEHLSPNDFVKRNMIRAAFTIGLLFASSVVLLGSCGRPNPANLSITSPRKTYELQLEEQLDGPTSDVPYEQIVWFSLLRNGQKFISKHELDGSENNDNRLWEKYKGYTWIS